MYRITWAREMDIPAEKPQLHRVWHFDRGVALAPTVYMIVRLGRAWPFGPLQGPCNNPL